jgi:hypothetical protein
MCHLVKNESACPRCHEHFYIRLVYCKFARGPEKDKIWGTCAFFERAFPDVYAAQCIVESPQDPEAIWRYDLRVQEALDSKAVIRALDVGPTLCNICIGIDRGELPCGYEDDQETVGPESGVSGEDDCCTEIFSHSFQQKATASTTATSPLEQPRETEADQLVAGGDKPAGSGNMAMTKCVASEIKHKRNKQKRRKQKRKKIIFKAHSSSEAGDSEAGTTTAPGKEVAETIVDQGESRLETLSIEIACQASGKPEDNSKSDLESSSRLPGNPRYRDASTQWSDDGVSEAEGSLTPTARAQNPSGENDSDGDITMQALTEEITESLSRADIASPEPPESEPSTSFTRRSSQGESEVSSTTSCDESYPSMTVPGQSWSDMVEEEMPSELFITRPVLSRKSTTCNDMPVASPASASSYPASEELAWPDYDQVYDLPGLDDGDSWTVVSRCTKKWKHWHRPARKMHIEPEREVEWDC